MLPETMQAVVVHGVEDYRLSEVPVPEIGPGEVLVRVLATGVCASDAKTYLGAARVWGGTPHEAIGYRKTWEAVVGIVAADYAVDNWLVFRLAAWGHRGGRPGDQWDLRRWRVGGPSSHAGGLHR